MEGIWKDVIITIVGIFASGLMSTIATVIGVWIKKKFKNEKLAQIAVDLNNIIFDSVKAVYQSFVQTLKDNDKFDEKAQKEAKQKAIDIVNGKLTEDMKDYVTGKFGDVASYVSSSIETALYDLKNK